MLGGWSLCRLRLVLLQELLVTCDQAGDVCLHLHRDRLHCSVMGGEEELDKPVQRPSGFPPQVAGGGVASTPMWTQPVLGQTPDTHQNLL